MVEAVSTIIHSFMEEMARSPSHAIRKFSRSQILIIKMLIELRFLVALSTLEAHTASLFRRLLILSRHKDAYKYLKL